VKENDAEVDVVELGGVAVSVECGAVRSTVQAHDVAAPTLDERSMARTAKLCAPAPIPEYDAGDEHAEYDTPSSAHSNVAASFAENAKLADVPFVSAEGPEVTVAVGGDAPETPPPPPPPSPPPPDVAHGGTTVKSSRTEWVPSAATASTPMVLGAPHGRPENVTVASVLVPSPTLSAYSA
jgi:hypothetical protein